MSATHHPATPCCGYEADKALASGYPVFWNPHNGVVQCHNCGHVFTPQALDIPDPEKCPEDPQGILSRARRFNEFMRWPNLNAMPVEATKLPDAALDAMRRGEGFKWLQEHQLLMTPEGRELYEKDKEEAQGTTALNDAMLRQAGEIWPNALDPNGLPQHAPGAKNDAGKQYASLLLDFSRALSAVAQVATMGANKYSRGGWQSVPDGITRYRDAEWRHMLKSKVEERDPESGLPHAFHRAWNVLAVLELELREEELRQQKNL